MSTEGDKLRAGEIVSGLLLMALGVLVIVEARQWEYLTPEGPGAGFFPLWYGVALAALAALLIAVNLIPGRVAFVARSVKWRAAGRALAAWGALVATVTLLKPLGFVASFALLTFFIVFVMYRERLWVALALAAGLAAGFYVVFPVALGLALPAGPWGF